MSKKLGRGGGFKRTLEAPLVPPLTLNIKGEVCWYTFLTARYHTFVEIGHEIIYTIILLPSADSFKKGCCQLQAKVCARITGYSLVQACPGKSVVR